MINASEVCKVTPSNNYLIYEVVLCPGLYESSAVQTQTIHTADDVYQFGVIVC